MSNRAALLAANGWRGRAYYLLFPLDWFGPDEDDARLAYQQLKIDELVPFHGVAVPLMVFLAAGTPLPWFAFLVLVSAQAAGLALLAMVHLKLAFNQAVELWLNTWLASLIMALVLALAAFAMGSLASPEVSWD